MAMSSLKLVVLLIVLYLAFGRMLIVGAMHPTESDWVLEINCFTMFNLARESGKGTQQEQAESVIKVLSKDEGINEKYMDSNMVKRLRQKLSSIMTPGLKALNAGGKQGALYLNKLKQNVHHLKLGSVKRKMEHELESERKRRRLAEEEVKKQKKMASKEIKNQKCKSKEERKKRKKVTDELKKKVKKAQTVLGRLTKRRQMRGNGKKKYSKTWKNLRKKELNNSIQFACNFLANNGINVKRMLVDDIYGNKVDFNNILVNESGPCTPTLDVNRMLYVKDSYLIPDLAYQAMALESNELLKMFAEFHQLPNPPKYPSLYNVRNRMKELNSKFSVQNMGNGKGVSERLEIKLKRVLDSLWPFDELDLTIKITGDGTSVGRLHVTNVGMCVISSSWRSDDMILAIAKIREKYTDLKEILTDIGDEISNLSQIIIHGQVINLTYIICADLEVHKHNSRPRDMFCRLLLCLVQTEKRRVL